MLFGAACGEEVVVRRLFRNSAAFGKRIEYWIVGKMLKEGLDVYLPLVDDDAVDAVIKRPDGSFIEVQIKASSDSIKMGDAAFFTAKHTPRSNYWFVFYSERLNIMFIMSSEEFCGRASQNRSGRHVGTWSLRFNGRRKDKNGQPEEYVKEGYKKYIHTDFSRLRE